MPDFFLILMKCILLFKEIMSLGLYRFYTYDSGSDKGYLEEGQEMKLQKVSIFFLWSYILSPKLDLIVAGSS